MSESGVPVPACARRVAFVYLVGRPSVQVPSHAGLVTSVTSQSRHGEHPTVSFT